MRSKSILVSLGFMATAWISGCQTLAERNASASKNGAEGSGSVKLSKEFDENQPWYQRNARLAARRGLDSASANPTTTTAAANCGCATVAAKQTAPTVVQACNTCSPGSALRVDALPAVPSSSLPVSIPEASQALPVVPAAYSQSSPAPNFTPAINPSFGPGVEIVSQDIGAPVQLPTGEKVVPATTMVVRFGQSNNYQTIVGAVYQFRRTWRLRYAAAESEDRFGGSVTLVGDNLDNLKDGQMVRVEGIVAQSEDRSAGARYHVQRLEVIEPK